jgi:hypothetical protein
VTANVTFEKIAPGDDLVGQDRVQRRSNFVFNPATGALEFTSDGFLKAHKALRREVRGIKFRLYCSLARLNAEKLLLQFRSACLARINDLPRPF